MLPSLLLCFIGETGPGVHIVMVVCTREDKNVHKERISDKLSAECEGTVL